MPRCYKEEIDKCKKKKNRQKNHNNKTLKHKLNERKDSAYDARQLSLAHSQCSQIRKKCSASKEVNGRTHEQTMKPHFPLSDWPPPGSRTTRCAIKMGGNIYIYFFIYKDGRKYMGEIHKFIYKDGRKYINLYIKMGGNIYIFIYKDGRKYIHIFIYI